MLWAIRWMAQARARAACTALIGVDVARATTGAPARPGLVVARSSTRARAIPQTWKDLVYLVGQFPLGLLWFA